jgi:hypothetical protein
MQFQFDALNPSFANNALNFPLPRWCRPLEELMLSHLNLSSSIVAYPAVFGLGSLQSIGGGSSSPPFSRSEQL